MMTTVDRPTMTLCLLIDKEQCRPIGNTAAVAHVTPAFVIQVLLPLRQCSEFDMDVLADLNDTIIRRIQSKNKITLAIELTDTVFPTRTIFKPSLCH